MTCMSRTQARRPAETLPLVGCWSWECQRTRRACLRLDPHPKLSGGSSEYFFVSWISLEEVLHFTRSKNLLLELLGDHRRDEFLRDASTDIFHSVAETLDI